MNELEQVLNRLAWREPSPALDQRVLTQLRNPPRQPWLKPLLLAGALLAISLTLLVGWNRFHLQKAGGESTPAPFETRDPVEQSPSILPEQPAPQAPTELPLGEPLPAEEGEAPVVVVQAQKPRQEQPAEQPPKPTPGKKTAKPQERPAKPQEKALAQSQQTPREVQAAGLREVGLVTAQLSPELAHHLDLKQGTGLVATRVSPDSWAGRIGLEKFDVLHSIDGQPAGAALLSRRLRDMARGKGDATLEVFRGGVALSLELKRGQLEAVKEQAEQKELGLSEDLIRRLPLEAQEILRHHLRPRTGRDGLRPRQARSAQSRSMTSVMDNEHHLKLTVEGDKRHLWASERGSGKILFDGPITTPDELEKVPAAIRKKLAGLLE